MDVIDFKVIETSEDPFAYWASITDQINVAPIILLVNLLLLGPGDVSLVAFCVAHLLVLCRMEGSFAL